MDPFSLNDYQQKWGSDGWSLKRIELYYKKQYDLNTDIDLNVQNWYFIKYC